MHNDPAHDIARGIWSTSVITVRHGAAQAKNPFEDDSSHRSDVPIKCKERCEQNPYQNAYYEALYTLGRAIYLTVEGSTSSNSDDVFDADKLLQNFNGKFEMRRYNNRLKWGSDNFPLEIREFSLFHDLDISLSVHQFFNTKLNSGKLMPPKCL